MCGIAGVFHFQKDAEVAEDHLRLMTTSIAHRGPDDDGYWRSGTGRLGLGFRRLSIVDLAGGHQPMSTQDGRYWIVFNGEIYNHVTIRQELESRGYSFRTRSDTEVILQAYACWGAKCIERFLGMFAFGIWDETEGRLFLARDRIGIKPLYYANRNGTLYFASEIKALFEHPDLAPRLNRDALAHYFTFLCVPPPATLFEGIEKLRAGHTLLVEAGKELKEPERYWTPLTGPMSTRSESELIDEVRATLTDAVRARLMADVPLGVFLSGGLDSSSIVALMSRMIDRPVETFSIGYKDDPGFNEFENARQTAALFGTHHHEIQIDHEDFRRFLPRLVHHQDEPIADPVCVPLYFVSELARQNGVKVALVGEGADELFFGYAFHNRVWRMVERLWNPLAAAPAPLRGLATRAAEPFVDLPRRDFLRRLRENGEPFLGGAVTFYPEELKRLAPALARDARPEAAVRAFYEEIDALRPDADFPTRASYLELEFRLPELLLMRVDKMTMATSVEGRVPFLDHRMVELAFRIPITMKVRDGVTKYVLREAMKDILPAEILQRRKMGFHVPVTRWFAAVLSPLAQDVLHDPRLERLEIWDKREVDRLLARRQDGRANLGMRIWSLVNFGLWYRHWFFRESL